MSHLFNKGLAELKAGSKRVINLIHKVPLLWKPEWPWTLASGSADTLLEPVNQMNQLIPVPNQEEDPSDLSQSDLIF